MNILVTGGSGFLGKHLLQALQEAGYTSLRVFNRSACQDLQAQGISVFQGDLADTQAVQAAVKGCEAVFHVAAKAGVWGSYRSYARPNILGTQNLLKACQEHHVRYFIYTSSPSVVFKGYPLSNVDETIGYGIPSKMCAYARTKLIAEQCVRAANGKNGLRTVALRPHLIWGPGDRHLIPTLLQAARKRQLVQVGEGTNWVDLSYVTNVAQAHVLALQALQEANTPVAGKAYFISQGDPVQLWPWIHQLLRKLGMPPITKTIPLRKAYALGACLEVLYKICFISKQPPMTRFVAKELSQDHYFNISAAKMDLHYIPQVSNEEGMEQLIRWLKQQPQ